MFDEIHLQAPDGTEIRGTSETIPGVADVRFWPEAPGFDHTGNGTEMFWDGALTLGIDGVPLFTDRNGADWLQHHLIPQDAEPLPADVIAIMADEIALGHALEKARSLIKDLEAIERTKLLAAGVDWVMISLERRYDVTKRMAIETRADALAAQERVNG